MLQVQMLCLLYQPDVYKRQGIDHEEYHEAADTAEGQQTSDAHDHRRYKVVMGQTPHGKGNGFRCPCELINCPEQCPYEENQEILGDIV